MQNIKEYEYIYDLFGNQIGVIPVFEVVEKVEKPVSKPKKGKK